MDTEGPGSSRAISVSTRVEGLCGNRPQKLRCWAGSHFSCACVDSLLSKDFSACEEQTLVFITLWQTSTKMIYDPRNGSCFSEVDVFIFFLDDCVNRTFTELIVTVPACVLDTSTL